MTNAIPCPRCNAPLPAGAAVCRTCGAPGPAGPVRPRLHIRVVRADGGPEGLVPMTTEMLTCGRRGNITVVDDPFVADLQARFYFVGARLAVEDVGGGNGVFGRIRQDRELTAGSELRLGRQRLVVEAMPPAATGADGATAWGSADPGYKFRLVQLLEGGVVGAAFPLKEGENALGREVGDITFPVDGFVSSRHAVLRVTGKQIVVRDVGSSNGTFLRLTAPTYVENGDQFLIGRQLLRVEMQA